MLLNSLLEMLPQKEKHITLAMTIPMMLLHL